MTLHDTLYRLIQEQPVLFTYPLDVVASHPEISHWFTSPLTQKGEMDRFTKELDSALRVHRANFATLAKSVKVELRTHFVVSFCKDTYDRDHRFPFSQEISVHLGEIYGAPSVSRGMILQARREILGEWAGSNSGSIKSFASKYNVTVKALKEAAEKGLLKHFQLERGTGTYLATTEAAVQEFIDEHPELCTPRGVQTHRSYVQVERMTLKGGVLAIPEGIHLSVKEIVVEGDTMMKLIIPKGAKVYGRAR